MVLNRAPRPGGRPRASAVRARGAERGARAHVAAGGAAAELPRVADG